MTEKTTKQLAQEVFRNELKASRKMESLVEESDKAEVESVFCDAFKDIVNEMEDVDNQRLMVSLMQRFGSSLQSEAMVNVALQFAQDHPEMQVQEK